jgi:protoporphyrinogen oxidase
MQKKMVIIGGGIAGLCAAVYAQKCGYAVDVIEMGHTAGGLRQAGRGVTSPLRPVFTGC